MRGLDSNYSTNDQLQHIYGVGDDDEFDCEFMESSFAQWEKAFLKRKKDVGKEDQASKSKIFNNVIHQESENGDQFDHPEDEIKQGPPCSVEENEVSAANGEDSAENHLRAEDGDDTTDYVENSFITDREKMKENDEYKRAVEEEWASRQKELQIQVRIAYKKALLNFHPDKASQSDIRQQVEAEEKFKLISCLKNKFLMTS